MRNKTVIPNGDEFTDKRMRLDPAALADGGSFLDFNERADECLISDPAAIKIYRLNNGNVFAEVNGGGITGQAEAIPI